MKLRPYQQDAVKSALGYLEKRQGHPLIVLPTGAGKSLVIAEIARFVVEHGGRVLVAAHVKELAAQNAEKLQALMPREPIGILCAGLGRKDVRQRVISCTVQTAINAVGDLVANGRISALIVDEAHMVPPKGEGRYRTLIASLTADNPRLRRIGLTATPYRMDQGWLTARDDDAEPLFTTRVYEIGMRELIADGYLSPLVSDPTSTHYDVTGVRVSGGDFDRAAMADAIDGQRDATIAATRETIAAGADRRGWMIFTTTRDQSGIVVKELDAAGISHAEVNADTPTKERDRVVREYKAGRIRCVVNVGIFTTGFDAPHVDMIAVLRPTASTSLYVQIVGRGLRIAEGKRDCLVLDFGGNVERHGPVDDVRIEPKAPASAKQKDKQGPRGLMCPNCWTEIDLTKFETRPDECPECGYQFPENLPELRERYRGSILGGDDDLAWYEVGEVSYSRHQKSGKPDSMRVTYWGKGGVELVSEWVCLDHGGYAGDRAFKWLSRRLPEDGFPPVTTDAALAMCDSFAVPEAVLVDESEDFPRVKACRWPMPDDEQLPA